MLPGRPPKPTLVKIAEGNRGKRPLSLDSEPKPTEIIGMPKIPRALRKAGRHLWRWVFENAMSEGRCWLTQADLALVESACVEHGIAAEAQAKVDAAGFTVTVTTRNGCEYEQQRPEVAIAAGARKRRDQLLAQLGFSPAGRAKLSIASNKPKADPVAEALYA